MADQNHVFSSFNGPQESFIQASQDARSLADVGGSFVSSMGPPKRRKKKAPTRRAKDWEPYKARILDLHDTQKLSLETVKNMIETEFGFTAELRQYRTRISQWGKDKNIKPVEMAAIVRKRQQRKLVDNDKGEQSFTVRGRTVEPQKIDRWMNRHEIPQTALYAPSPAASTPSAVGCRTISEIGSVAPSPVFSSQGLHVPPGETVSMAPSPVACSPTHTSSTAAQSPISVFSGQSPAPILQPLPTNSLASHSPTPNSFFRGQLNYVLETTHHRYKQTEEERLREELSVVENSLGADDSLALVISHELADVLADQGRYKAAEVVIRKGLENYPDPIGHESVQWLDAMNCLGQVLCHQGLYLQALQLQQRIFELKKARLREDDPSTLFSMVCLSETYRRQGRQLEEAEVLGAQVFKMLSRTQGDEHPATVSALRNLLRIYHCQGWFKEAEELGLLVVAKGKKVFGEQHPDTLVSMGWLASVYADQGRLEEAEDLEVKVMDMRSKIFGEEHPATLINRSNLAWIYRRQGRLNEAEELGVQVLGTRRRILGEKHPSTLWSLDDLILVYEKKGQPEKAEELKRLKLEMERV
ncbi:hypothetical protein ACHAQI_007486 [Fusarium lateritium]